MFTRRAAVVAIFAWSTAFLAACDDSQEVPDTLLNPQVQPQDAQQDNAADPSTRPTTQQLMTGERVNLQLDTLPLRMKVPPQWQITREGGGIIVMLNGPTPHGEANIQLKEREAIPAREFDNLMSGIKREQSGGAAEGTVSVRAQGPVQFVERQSFMRPMNLPVTDATGVPLTDEKGEPRMQRSTPMRWRVNVFVPREETYDFFELNFIDLSKEQYEVDREFLQQMLGSLQYVGPLLADDGTTTAPAAPATPSTNR